MRKSGKQKGLSAVDFFCIGFGAIVGVGWAVSINSWMTNCGGPVPAGMGYILVLIMMVPIALCYCELVPMLPVAGGGMAGIYSNAASCRRCYVSSSLSRKDGGFLILAADYRRNRGIIHHVERIFYGSS